MGPDLFLDRVSFPELFLDLDDSFPELFLDRTVSLFPELLRDLIPNPIPESALELASKTETFRNF